MATDTQKTVVLFCTINEAEEKEIKESIPFKIISKNIKYIGIKLTKEEGDLYNENFKTPKKAIEDLKKAKKNPMLMDWNNQYC